MAKDQALPTGIGKLDPGRAAAMAAALLEWFERSRRPLPWREAYPPYGVLVSEFMGQQTQMERVVEYYRRFMDRFPTVERLAEASIDEVTRQWEGLGYYSRAKNLHRAAREIMAHHGGRVPRTVDALAGLPGVGPYTAAAVASIAFDQRAPLVDANVARLFARLFDLDLDVRTSPSRKGLAEVAGVFMGECSPRLFNQAVMELGALVCRPRRPVCGGCPLSVYCLSLARGTVEARPAAGPPPQRVELLKIMGVVQAPAGFAVRRRPGRGLWANLWEFPSAIVEQDRTPEETAGQLLQEVLGGRAPLRWFPPDSHSYTRHRVRLLGFYAELSAAVPLGLGFAWATSEELGALAMPAGERLLRRRLQLAGSSSM